MSLWKYVPAAVLIAGCAFAVPGGAGEEEIVIPTYYVVPGGEEPNWAAAFAINQHNVFVDRNIDGSHVGIYDRPFNVISGRLEPGDDPQDFGRSIVVSETKAYVGKTIDHDGGPRAGAVYVFDIESRSLIKKIVPKDLEGAHFSASLELEGSILAVGIPCYDSNKGGVYLYDADTFEPLSIVQPHDLVENEYFGMSVVIEGDILAISRTRTILQLPGRVHLYDISDPTSPVLLSTTYGDDTDPPDLEGFGRSIEIVNNKLYVGVSHKSECDDRSGCVHTYNISDPMSPALTNVLVPMTCDPQLYFGSGIKSNGSVIYVSAESPLQDTKSVYVFDLDTQQQLFRMISFGVCHHCFGHYFGYPLAIHGDQVLARHFYWEDIGAPPIRPDLYYYDLGPRLCRPDINQNGVVDAVDLVALLGTWGECNDTVVCRADFDYNDVVDTADLLEMIFNWGPCD